MLLTKSQCTGLSSPVRVTSQDCNFIVLSRNELLLPSIVREYPADGDREMEVTPRPKYLSTAIAIGLAGFGLLVFLSVIR